MQQYYKGIPIPPCPKVKVMVTRHKGRIGAGLIGGILLGPLGLTAGALRGGRDESTWEEREPTFSERMRWINEWRKEFDRTNPNFVPLPVPKKPMGRLTKIALWCFLAYIAAIAVFLIVAAANRPLG